MYPFSYSAWASRIVSREESRSLREASCWSVEVVNGAAGLRRYGLDSTDETVPSVTTPAIAVALASSRCTAADVRSAPSSPKSRPVATRAPSTAARRASKDSSPRAKRAVTSQYEADRNAMRSRSRSTTRRVATDCTRPADRPGPILRHSSGETS